MYWAQDNNEDDKSRAMALAALGSRLEAVGVAQSEESTGKELQSSINKVRRRRRLPGKELRSGVSTTS